MPELWTPLAEIVVVLAAAMVLGSIAERLKQSAIMGFMLAGLILGPNVAGLVEDEAIIAIADLGVTLLMFTIGLEFSWSRLRRLGKRALVTGTAQILITMGVAAAVGLVFGLNGKASIAVGAIVALSSTGVVMPALAQRGEVDSVHGRFDLGILLLQDAAVIPLVLVVAAMGQGGGDVTLVLFKTAIGFGVAGTFVLSFWVFSKYIVPALVAFNAPTGNRDVTVLFAIVVSIGAAWLAWYQHLSPALGAFIAAIFLGESVIAPRLRGDVSPLKTVFVTLFFTSIGMLADPAWMTEHWFKLSVTTVMVVIGKPIIVAALAWMSGLSIRHAVAAGICMGQVGVFSFVLARVAVDNSVITEHMFSLMVSVTILTLFATPYLVGGAATVGTRVERLLRKWGWVKRQSAQDKAMLKELSGHVIVVGFGPAGRAVADRVYLAGTPVVVVDLNPRSVLAARGAGMRAVVGDASSQDLLKQIAIDTAEALVITLPDHLQTMAVILEAREMSPTLTIIARSRYHRYVELLETTGATQVIDEEASVGDRLGESLRLQGSTDTNDPRQVLKEESPEPAAQEPKASTTS